MAIHMRNGIPYGGIPNGIVSGETPSTVPTTVKQLNQVGAVGKIAPVTIPSAVKFSNGDTLETAIGSVATIETSPTVAAHEVGEFIFYNGQMYRVIATIAVGETLTVDTNIEATSVGAELTSLNNDLMQGMKPVLLWEGDKIGSGSITVEGLSEWFLIAIANYANDEYLLIGSPVRGGLAYGIYDGSGTATMGYRFTGSLDSDTLTIDSKNRGLYAGQNSTYSYSSTGSNDVHIRRIYGLMKKPTSI